MLRTVFTRVCSAFDQRRSEEEVDREITAHLAMLTERFMRQGMDAQEARDAARRQFGGVSQLTEELHERRSVPWIETFMQDTKFGVRQLLIRDRRFTLVAASVLALAIGAATAMFSVIDGVLLRPLPYPNAEELVWVGETLKSNTADELTLTPDFLDWRSQNHVFTAMAGINYRLQTLAANDGAIPLRTVKASAALLPILKIRPLLGRNFLASEDRRGKDQVAILSYALWQQSFGGARDVIGRRIALDEGTLTIVGVLPADFHFPALQPIDVMTPLGKNEELELKRGAEGLTVIRDVIARLRPGVTLAQARAEMAVIESRLAPAPFHVQTTVKVLAMQERFVGNIRTALVTLLSAVAFLLMMACANVANLLLSRLTSRQREMAIRAALGASRRRIVQQLLVESFVLAGMSCAGGFTLALWIRGLLVGLVPKAVPGPMAFPLDFRVFGFAVAVACLSAVTFGLGPALASAGPAISPALMSDGRTFTAGARRQVWLNLLASAQIGIAIILLSGGGLMLQSFWKLRYRDLGFARDNLLTARLNLSGPRYADRSKQIAFFDELLSDIRNLPGVEAAGLGSLPPGEGHATNGFGIEGRVMPPVGRRPVARQYSVSPEYFRLLGVALLQGRGIAESDTWLSVPVAMINETFARRNFAGEKPIGKRIRAERNDPWRTIVGVAADVKTAGLAAPPEPVIYFPYRQSGAAGGEGILIRTAFDAATIGPELRKRVALVDPRQPIIDIQTLDQRLTESVAKPRLAAVLLGCFAGLGLLMAAVGLYGVMSFLVRSRFREIGIRLAIGAQPGDVTRMILTHSLRLILAGVAVGLGCAFWLSRLIEGLLYEVSPTDPVTIGLAVAFLVLVCLAASYLPGRQASEIDPAVTLRTE
jgi:putative ABC transport system permease protein